MDKPKVRVDFREPRSVNSIVTNPGAVRANQAHHRTQKDSIVAAAIEPHGDAYRIRLYDRGRREVGTLTSKTIGGARHLVSMMTGRRGL